MYDKFATIQEAKNKYHRCRKMQHFILEESAANNCTCAVCHKAMPDTDASPGYRGNRCMYRPGDKKVFVMHYLCAWNALLKAAFRQYGY